MIRNLKVNNRVLFTMCLSGVMVLSSGCTDVESSEDFNKSFNVVVENNDDKISVVGIKAYSNYGDNQIQFVTNDDLKVVSSISKVQLLKINDEFQENQIKVIYFINSLGIFSILIIKFF